MYRLKTSGADHHKYLKRDSNNYFGIKMHGIGNISENLYGDGTDKAEGCVEGWISSEGHYKNMISSSHKCGAIAFSHGIAVGIFVDMSLKEFNNNLYYKSYLTVKEITADNEDIADGFLYYYDKDLGINSKTRIRIQDTSIGKVLVLEPNRTYIIYDTKCKTLGQVEVIPKEGEKVKVTLVR